ncbi:MAG TPA: hypothetical protein VIM16_06385 [Mucilaginibacter sp.]|jgi:hypothetical protein
MESIPVLKKKSEDIQEEIRTLLLDNYRFDYNLIKQLNVVNNVTSLRNELAIVQREIRERLSA